MSGPAWLRGDDRLAGAGWRHGWTTAAGPDFRGSPSDPAMAAAMERLCRGAGLDAAAWVHQVHGGTVLRAGAPGLAGPADALWTTEPRLAVVGRGADCPLVLVGGRCDDGGAVWGFAHASWRSTVAGITPALVAAMAGAGLRLATARALICPSAGPCCYEVGNEVREAMCAARGGRAAAWFAPHRAGDRAGPAKWRLDLWAANEAELTAAGVPAAAIGNLRHCTICGGPLYPSHRRDGDDAGRLAAFIAGPAG